MATRRTGLWLLTTFLLFLLIFTVFAWGLNRLLVGGSPTVGSATVLEIRLQGALGEVAHSGPFVGPLTVREIDAAVRRAADDDRVEALFLDVGPLLGGYAKTQEVRAAIRHFRDSGKPVVALLELGSNLDLYMASVADTVYLVPTGQLFLGMLVQESFYRELFDKLGVSFEVFATGPYKAAFSSFTNTELSEEEREMNESLLDSLYHQWLDDVSVDRELPPEALAAAFDEGLVPAARAVELGLVDELGYRGDVDERLADTAGRAPRRLGVREYLQATGSPQLLDWFGSDVIALIHVNGMMLPGEFEDGLFGADVAAGNTIARYVREAREDPAVKAVVLRIDSGGGAVTAADVMGREIELAAQRKPVIASMSDVAASGGYWIASKATRVLANPGTYTGSIGVVAGRLSLAGTYDLVGIDNEILKRGENADLLADSTRLRPDQRRLLERSVYATYADFLDVVARGRDMERGAVEAVAAGRVWTGEQALANGLIDELGGLHEAIASARAQAGIGPMRSATLRVYPPRRSFFEEVSRLFTAVASSGALQPGPAWLPPPVRAGWERFSRLRAAGPIWTLIDTPLPAAAR